MRLLPLFPFAIDAATLGLATMSGITWANAQVVSPSANPSELAATIARTMNTFKPTTSVNSLITQETISDKNIVESHTTFKDAKAFANAAAQKQKLQIGSARYMCKAERLPFIKKGVVFRNVFHGPESADVFSFDVDERVCASLQTAAIADTPTLTKMAGEISKALPGEPAFAGSKFAGVDAHDGNIQLSYDIVAPAFVDFFKYKSFEIRGKTQGLFCPKFGDAIRRGVRIKVIYRMDTTPIVAFPVDNSVC